MYNPSKDYNKEKFQLYKDDVFGGSVTADVYMCEDSTGRLYNEDGLVLDSVPRYAYPESKIPIDIVISRGTLTEEDKESLYYSSRIAMEKELGEKIEALKSLGETANSIGQ